jgi:hypothetical protein
METQSESQNTGCQVTLFVIKPIIKVIHKDTGILQEFGDQESFTVVVNVYRQDQAF